MSSKEPDNIRPEDSASQVASRVSGKSRSRSQTSAASEVRSSVSSVRMKEEAKIAALEARAAALKQKQILDRQEYELRQQRELLEIETELKVSTAKANVYKQYDESTNSQLANLNIESGANKSLDKVKEEPLRYEGSKVVPETPMNPVVEVFTPANHARPESTHSLLNSSVDRTVNKDSVLHELLQKQNEITERLVDHQKRASLPRCEIQVFDGKLQNYRAFISSFAHNIDSVATNNRDKLHLLYQYTSGRARDIVKGCMGKNPDRGYVEARQELEDEYGDEFEIAQAYKDEIELLEPIRHEDKQKLKDFLTSIIVFNNAMEDNEVLRSCDQAAIIQKLLSKLPYKLRDRWRSCAYHIRTYEKRLAGFPDFVVFMKEQVRIITDSIYGDISHDQGHKDLRPRKPVFERKPKRSSFGLNVQVHKDSGPSASTCANLLSITCAMETPCLYCGDVNHTMERCDTLRSKPYEERIKFMKSKGLCFRCLNRQHMSKNCTKPRMQCLVCQQRHPTVLHLNRSSNTVLPENSEQRNPEAENLEQVSSNCTFTRQNPVDSASTSKGALSILPVRVKAKASDKSVLTYAFLDNGSTDTFCTERLAKRLNLNGRNTKIILRTLRNTELVNSQVISGIEVCDFEGHNAVSISKAYTQTELPVSKHDITTQQDIERYPYLKDVTLPSFDSDHVNIDLLIGTDVPQAMEPWCVVRSQDNGPYAVKTRLGWAVNGPLDCMVKDTSKDHMQHQIKVNRISVDQSLEQQVVKQFNYEFSERISEDTPEKSIEDQQFLRMMSDTVTVKDGHYQTCLPVRSESLCMPHNRGMAEQSAVNLKRRLIKDSKLHSEYNKFMTNMIEKGYAEEVPETELERNDGRVWYIPHHGVYHPRKGKIRVVFNCAAKFQGTSLNDKLLQGPDLTNGLIGVLLRFRQEPVALMADIEAMFYQVKVKPEDCDLLRFLWWPSGDLSVSPKDFRMVVHLFGAVSSPSCANFALRKTADDNQNVVSPEVISTIKRNFYVDDCLKAVSTERKASALVSDLKETCAKGGFNLTKWVCNRPTVLKAWPKDECAMGDVNLDLEHEPHIERALGVQWCVDSDKFKFRILINERPSTRRGILSIVSAIYDPLGFLSPFTLVAKQILQTLCKSKFAWDEEIPSEYLRVWHMWLAELPTLRDFDVNRCVKPVDFGIVKSAQIHHFCDASELAYGTVSYIRLINEEGHVHCAFLIGKARVAPLKQITIPRMELTAATVAVRIDKLLKRELEIEISDTFYWTDSQSVLCYINSETARFRTFVANRVSVIRDGSQPAEWNYISSASNPADDASRGLHAKALLENPRWIRGPDFLWETDVDQMTNCNPCPELCDDDPELRKKVVVSMITADNSDNTIDRFIAYHSDWFKLKKHVAWILKIRAALRDRVNRAKESTRDSVPHSREQRKTKPKRNRNAVFITLSNMETAEHAILTYVQRQAFPEEISALSCENQNTTMGGRNHSLKRSSTLYKLDPHMTDGLLRVGGRLDRAILSEDTKHPIILPKDSHVSYLILRQLHKDTNHSGRNHLIAYMRQKYWILKSHAAARKIVHECVDCRKQRGKVGEQKMADLPADRLTTDDPPFTHVGVDYFGPFEVKQGRSLVKRYGVVFTCLTIRAVHIEVSCSLDTDSCINALRRFIARRGQVRTIRSDNGTNLVSAKRELEQEIKKWNQDKIRDTLLQKNINWIFNPPLGSHHGGIWERQIRTIRKILNTILKNQTLDDERLHTFMCEAEATINSRPITNVSMDPNDFEPLTPNHLLLLKTGMNLPPGLFEKSDIYAKRRWRQVQYLADLFWKRWTREYLPLLQERQKWFKCRRNYSVGNIVLIVDESAPRNSWSMGRVIETTTDKKGFVRRVKVKTKSTVLERPVDKLCMLLETDQP